MTVRAGVLARQSRAKVKSIEDQLDECLEDAREVGAEVSETYTDGVSASRYGKRVRQNYQRLVADVEAGDLDMVVCWSPDRAGREIEEWARFLNLCRRKEVLIRVTDHGRTYDLTRWRDYKTLAEEGIQAAGFSEELSSKVRRGVRHAAKAGRPAAGPCPYGYERTYDPSTGELSGQVVVEDEAAVVREIITRLAKSDTVSAITNDLNSRGVAPPGGGRQWYRERVKTLAKNVAYIGVRKHKAEGHAAAWAPIVDEADFYAAQRVLGGNARPLRPGVRPGKQKHLLTYLATCVRGHEIHARQTKAGTTHYYCPQGCVMVRKDKVDDLIEDLVKRRLRMPDVYKRLRQQGATDDKEALTARGEVARLEAQLDDWRASATDGRGTTPESLARIEADLTGQIRAARARERRASIPPALRPFLEPSADVAARWAEATVVAKREVMRYLGLRVTILPAARNAYTFAHERVDADFNG